MEFYSIYSFLFQYTKEYIYISLMYVFDKTEKHLLSPFVIAQFSLQFYLL